MDDIVISTSGVTKLIENLKPYKAVGPDKINPLVMKQLVVDIAPILTMPYHKSYETGHIPMDWKRAEVTPVFKKGSKTAASLGSVYLSPNILDMHCLQNHGTYPNNQHYETCI